MRLKKIKKLKIPLINEINGKLSFIEFKKGKKFNIKRVFFVKADKNSIRGKHAHKKIFQVLICISGKIEVECDDGFNKKTFFLNQMDEALFIPNMIWSVLKYKSNNSIIAVLCDNYYNELEYIRSYKEFKKRVLTKS